MNGQTELIGLFKRTFADKIIELYQNENPILDSVPFEQKNGEEFDQPVDLRFEHAFTSVASSATVPSGSGYQGYLDPIAGLTSRALVTPIAIHGRASVAYTAMSEAAAKGERAFASAAGHIVKRMTRSHAKRLEIQLLRGRKGVGTIESGSSPGGGVATFVVTADTWSEGLWSGMIGARLTVYLSTALKSTQASAITVSAVTPSTRTISVTGTSDATGLDLLATAGSYVTFETATIANGAANTNEIPGFKFWAGNTGSLYNISAATEPLWAGTEYSTSLGTPSLSKLLDMLTVPSSYGLMNALSVAIVPPRAFNVIVSDQAALRRYNAAEKTGKNGFSFLEFNVQSGTLRLQPHAYQADGQMEIYCPDSVRRVGSTEINFIQRQGNEDRLVLESSTSPAGEMRSLSNQTLFCDHPKHVVAARGMTY